MKIKFLVVKELFGVYRRIRGMTQINKTSKKKEFKMNTKYQKSFGGREKYFPTKYKKDRTNDCVVRAIAHITGLDYLSIFKDLLDLSLKTGHLPNEERTYGTYLKNLGWVKNSPLTHSGRKKYKIKNIPLNQSNHYLIHTCGHVTALVDGTLLDSWDCREWKAQSYYTRAEG